MSKNKKIFYTVLLSIAVSLGIAWIVLYCLFKENTQKYTWLTIDYICNKPLPVISISALTLAIIIYKVVRFIVNNKNTKINALKDKINTLENELTNKDEQIKLLAEKIEQGTEKAIALAETVNNNLIEVCNTIPNKKVKALGEKFYGKETNDSCSETKEI